MNNAPEWIWIDPEGYRDGWTSLPEQVVDGDVMYRRADLPPTLAVTMMVEEVRELVEAASDLCAARKSFDGTASLHANVTRVSAAASRLETALASIKGQME